MQISGDYGNYSLLLTYANQASARTDEALMSLASGDLEDLPAAWTELTMAQTQEQAVLAVIRTAGEMDQNLLDILA